MCDPDISLAAALALFGAFGYNRPAALNGPPYVAESILQEPIVPADGKLPAAQTGPGLGVDVDEQKMARLLVKELA